MNRFLLSSLGVLIAFLFTVTTGCTASPTSSADLSKDPLWTTNYDAALVKAKESGKRVLVFFTGSDWCHWCIRMDEETLTKAEFRDYASAHLELVYVDFPMSKEQSDDVVAQNRRLREQYGVDGFPTFVVLSPDGKEVDRRAGYVSGGPKNFIYFLDVTQSAEKQSK